MQRRQILECLDDLHDFYGASGWLTQVTVKLHEGKEDEVGRRISAAHRGPHERRYKVEPELLIRVTLKNLSEDSDPPLQFAPVYIGEEGEEEAEALESLKSGDSLELPYPLQKDVGEKDDGWDILDPSGAKVLKLRFSLE